MIKIIKDDDEKIVTFGAYENMYKDMGYEIINDNKSKVKTENIIENKEPISVDGNKDITNKDLKGNK